MLRPKRTGRVKITDIRQAYHGWCRERGLDPLPDPEIGRALNVLFSSVGLHRRGEGANAVIVGMEWKQQRVEARAYWQDQRPVLCTVKTATSPA
jgi:hypothetical protein